MTPRRRIYMLKKDMMERHVEEELHPILTPEIDRGIHAGSRTGCFIFRQTVHGNLW